jgi:uncharacterized protein (TIGR03435 family)
MTPHFSQDQTDDFGAAVARFRQAMDQRVDAHLRAHPHAGVPRVTRAAGSRLSTRPWALGAAVALVVVAIGTAVLWPRGPQRYATGEAGMQFTLADDSRVEMRAHSKLTVDRAADGLRIQLGTGGIIVNAAKQRSGHLYVETKDMTVSVVGTVFVVNATDEGSRVAVIEGEVRVHEGNTATTLRPGEQVSTNPAVTTRPVKEEIAWSREADALGAILATFTRGMELSASPRTPLADVFVPITGEAQPAAPRPQFEEASVRTCDPDNIPAPPAGARGGGANSFQMTPGRTYALCMTLATLIRTAYGYGPAVLDFVDDPPDRGPNQFNAVYGLGVEDGTRVRGGPDWVRSEQYTIEAVAEGSANAETMSGPMLRALLERRFKLNVHIETEQVPAFALTAAPGGLKIKPATEGACEPLAAKPGSPVVNGRPVNVQTPPRNFADVRRGQKPSCGLWPQRNGPNVVFVGGEVAFDELVRLLGFRLGAVRVLNKTGLTDRFNFVLEFVLDENSPGPGVPGADLLARANAQGAERVDVPRAATIFTAIEEQLGLKLEPARVPREFIVIDHIERPGPN